MWMFWFVAAEAATLDEALRAADEYSVEIVAIDAGADASRARIGQARAALVPKVAVNGSWTWNDEAVIFDLGAQLPPELAAMAGEMPAIEVQPKQYLQGSATLIVPIVDLDAVSTISAATRSAEASRSAAKWDRSQVRFGVAQAWYGVILAREGLALAEDAAAIAVTRVDLAERSVAAGISPPYDALAARSGRYAAERDVLAARAGVVAASAVLGRFTGLTAEDVTEGGSWVIPANVEAAIADGRGRADVVAARERAEAARSADRAADLRWAPDIDGRLTGVITQNQGFNDDKLAIGVLSATWTLDGGYTAARAREAGAVRVQADAAALSAERVAESEVRAAWAEVERADAASLAASEQVKASEAAVGMAEAAYAAGVIPFVELDQATLGLQSARRGLASEKVAADLARIRLLVATGGF